LSFRAVYDEHFAFVWRLAANRGVPARALEDVAQEAFIAVHRKLPEFEGRSSLRTWIAAIVRRVIADYVKKRGNRAAGDETLDTEPPAGVSPAERLERRNAGVTSIGARDCTSLAAMCSGSASITVTPPAL
jgi:RNA polymerase sigma-70 factor, ECF subfamily